MAAYATRQSTAVDYRTLAPQVEEYQDDKARIEVLHKNRKARRPAQAKVPYGKYIFLGMCVFGVLMMIVFSYMSVNELAVQNDQMRSEIASLKGMENSLNAKKERLYNLAFVEDYAKNVLGMVKLDKSEIRYVELSNPERMTVSKPQETGSGGISNLAKSFSAVLEYLN